MVWFGTTQQIEPAATADGESVMQQLADKLRRELESDLQEHWERWAAREVALRTEEARQRERERYADELARYQSDCEDDLAERVRRQRQRAREELHEELGERLETAVEQAEAWQARAILAERALLHLVSELLPRLDAWAAPGRHLALKTLDLDTLNAVLAHHQERLVVGTTDSACSFDAVTEAGTRTVQLAKRVSLAP